jgi:hypothetical protein
MGGFLFAVVFRIKSVIVWNKPIQFQARFGAAMRQPGQDHVRTEYGR